MARKLGYLSDENLVMEEPISDDALTVANDIPDVDGINAVATELEDLSDNIENGQDGAEALEQAAAPLEEAVQNNEPLPVPAAESLRILADRIFTSATGIPSNSRRAITFGMEGFKEKRTALQATNLAMESFKERAAAIWKYIVDAVRSAIQAVKNFFARLFDGATKLKALAEKLGKTATEKANATAEKTTIESAGFAEKLQIAGAAPEGDAYVAKFGTFVDGYATKYFKESVESTRSFMDNVKLVLAGAADWGKVKEKAKNLAHLVTFGKAGQSSQVPPEGMEVTKLDLACPGDKEIMGFTFKSDATDAQIFANIGRIKVWVQDVEGRKAVDGKNVAALSPAKAKELADKVGVLAQALLDAKKGEAQLDTQLKNLEQAAAGLKKVGDAKPAEAKPAEGEGEKAADPVAVCRGAVVAANNLATTTLAATRSYAVTTGNAACSYISASLALYKAAAAAAA